ncbi:hypothetical protein I546_3431 [Mycobacterium kansasii 732]|nr:hypothetical protein I546_3431 [Mycobacterium kansasii 732]
MLVMITTRIIGVGEYQISSEEAGVINARYVSSGSVRSSSGIGSGRARGDTSNGFPAITVCNTSTLQAN